MEAVENVVRQRGVEIVRNGVHAAVDAQAASVLRGERHQFRDGFTAAAISTSCPPSTSRSSSESRVLASWTPTLIAVNLVTDLVY